MEYIVVIISVIVAGYFCVRYFLLKQALRAANRELKEIVQHLEENRVVKITQPNRDLEQLLITINATLDSARHNALSYMKREEELKKRIEHISHDLRTPLTSIIGYLSLIEEPELSDDSRESMETVKRKAESLQRLITQFYELSRLSGSEEYALDLEQTDIGRLAREAALSNHALLTERGIELTLNIPDHPISAITDSQAIERVFSNLLHNAGRYARSCLTIQIEEHDSHSIITFENDTAPLDHVQAEQLFEPFFTADKARSQESSGLGLTISRQLAEHMGGSLDAKIDRREERCWFRLILSLPSL